MKTFLLFLFISCTNTLSAQTQFISKGKIEFERKTNVWAELRGSFADQIKKTIPQYQSSYFNYEFDNNKSIYQPGRESDNNTSMGGFFGRTPSTDNEVYSDFTSKKYIAHKEVFEKSFLIEDSLRNAKWKITSDFREIAGFNCRRATTIIMDSVFVVAFYTDEIMIPGGPESFNGLPGMIMGLVINRLHTTWYATKVEVNSVNDNDITPPTKGKKTDNADLKEILKKSLSDWGDYAQRNIWTIMI
ncbi:MAG: GLPGLI family protein [Ginsengibacter sp.]